MSSHSEFDWVGSWAEFLRREKTIAIGDLPDSIIWLYVTEDIGAVDVDESLFDDLDDLELEDEEVS